MIFQAFQLFPLLTVLENVCFPMEANGVKQKEAKAKAKELLTSVGISEEQYQRYPANLSGGEQQRVAPCPPVQGSFWPTSPRATWTRPTATR